VSETNEQIAQNWEQIEQIQSEQGWNRDSMLDLAKDFLNQEGRTTEFLYFLKKQQLEEKGNEGYEHLDDAQVESLRAVLKSIYMAGDGSETNSQHAADSIYDGYNINEIIDELKANDIDLRKRIDFDPETGEAWED
jgi:hypothetical protein